MNSPFLNTMTLKIRERLNHATPSLDALRHESAKARQPHNFLSQFLQKKSPRIIAEIKFGSPTLGRIKTDDPIDIANDYLQHGASAISILTESEYFHGSLDYLKRVRQAFPNALLLMKDFILDEYQLYEARIYGADSVLLIVAFLSQKQLEDLYTKALQLNLTPLVEVHTIEELQRAKSLGAKLIGINNRNLQTLNVDISVSKNIIKQAEEDHIFISESGLKDAETLMSLQQQGYQGFLIGSLFMQKEHPGIALHQLINHVNHYYEN